MYSLSEEAVDSGGSDADVQEKGQRAEGKNEKGLLETEKVEAAAANEAQSGNSEVLNTEGAEETEEKDKESSACSDLAADGCSSGLIWEEWDVTTEQWKYRAK